MNFANLPKKTNYIGWQTVFADALSGVDTSATESIRINDTRSYPRNALCMTIVIHVISSVLPMSPDPGYIPSGIYLSQQMKYAMSQRKTLPLERL